MRPVEVIARGIERYDPELPEPWRSNIAQSALLALEEAGFLVVRAAAHGLPNRPLYFKPLATMTLAEHRSCTCGAPAHHDYIAQLTASQSPPAKETASADPT